MGGNRRKSKRRGQNGRRDNIPGTEVVGAAVAVTGLESIIFEVGVGPAVAAVGAATRAGKVVGEAGKVVEDEAEEAKVAMYERVPTGFFDEFLLDDIELNGMESPY